MFLVSLTPGSSNYFGVLSVIILELVVAAEAFDSACISYSRTEVGRWSQ